MNGTTQSFAVVWLERLLIGCLFLFTIFAPHSIAVTQTAWLLGMLFWVSRFAFFPPPSLKKTPLDYALLGFFIVTGISAFLSYEPLVSIGKLRAASLFTIVYLFAENVPTRRVLRSLVLLLVGSCLINVGYVLGERAIGRGVKVQGVKTNSPLYTAGVRDGDTILEVDHRRVHEPDEIANRLAGPQPNEEPKAAVKIYRVEWIPTFKVERGKLLPGSSGNEQLGIGWWTKGRDWRASGFFGHYVTYAEALQLILALAFALFVVVPVKRSKWGILLGIAILGLAGAMLLTVTRASWLACVCSCVLILLFGASRRMMLGIAVLLIPVVLVAFLVLQQKRKVGFMDQRDQSTAWRETVWREGFHLLVSKPRHLLIGIGMDSIKSHWREWGMFEGGKLPIGHMHSNILQIALERGVPALMVWLLLLALYVRLLFRLRKRLRVESEDDRTFPGPWVERGLVLGALGGLVGFFVSGLVHFNWGDSEVVMILYLLMGLVLALNRMIYAPPSQAAIH